MGMPFRGCMEEGHTVAGGCRKPLGPRRWDHWALGLPHASALCFKCGRIHVFLFIFHTCVVCPSFCSLRKQPICLLLRALCVLPPSCVLSFCFWQPWQPSSAASLPPRSLSPSPLR